MDQSVIFAGFGGQGLLFAGHVLAQAAVDAGLSVSWLPSYGPEMRGGTASCTVVVADRPVGSPVVDAADCVVVLNPPSLMRFEEVVAPGGLLVVNTSLIEAEPRRHDIEVCGIPCSRLARTAGDDRLVSIVGLAALIARRPIVTADTVRNALQALAAGGRPDLVAANLAAWEAGVAAAAAGGSSTTDDDRRAATRQPERTTAADQDASPPAAKG